MATPYTRWEVFYQKLSLIFHAIVAVTMIPFAWAFLETQREFSEPIIPQFPWLWLPEGVLILAAAALVWLAHQRNKRLLWQVRQEAAIPEKLRVYLRTKKYQYALLEAAAALAFLGLFLTHHQLFTVLYLLVLFLFSLARPHFDKIAREIGVAPNILAAWGRGEEVEI